MLIEGVQACPSRCDLYFWLSEYSSNPEAKRRALFRGLLCSAPWARLPSFGWNVTISAADEPLVRSARADLAHVSAASLHTRYDLHLDRMATAAGGALIVYFAEEQQAKGVDLSAVIQLVDVCCMLYTTLEYHSSLLDVTDEAIATAQAYYMDALLAALNYGT